MRFALHYVLCTAAAFTHAPTCPPRARRATALHARGAQYAYGSFPSDLSATDRAAQAFPVMQEQTSALPPAVAEVGTAALLGLALYLGPDWVLAPLGLESQVRPGRATAFWLGQRIAPNSTFVTEREAGFAAEPPLPLKLATAAVYAALGAAAETLVVDALGSSTAFVGAWAVCACLAGGIYEVGRPQPLSREEFGEREGFEDAFATFAETRLDTASSSAAVNIREIVPAFRRANAKYRNAEYAGVADVQIERLAKSWWRQRGGVVTSTGFLKGVRLAEEADVFR
mmetsp:Transcript_24213/g.72649  ORF Transcript_24213/g.72649 Transcript_24213/m.72649 type:complete len:285 (-) Transcript_24213:36-890(-)|eukprot:CAMPEP_0119278204 /NCGR_PEP_ID=MMETSP1329-20130426/18684_1 /TAXON_ID=114041 /ORGANISM="Genus nov. species nov., Strain RCC1024" /LENGTH=284 /DNA_ID=CAMNT_0007278707 /DNA_START=153 /DNA_END=1007 /DNA_ORIENTATION=+